MYVKPFIEEVVKRKCCVFCHRVFVLHTEGRGCPKGMDLRQYVPPKLPITQRGEVRKCHVHNTYTFPYMKYDSLG